MKRNYTMKNTISFKQFILEFGENFSKQMKKRLLEIGTRCILTRKKESSNILDLKHVEHTKYDVGNASEMEYAYGQFIVQENVLYFSENCVVNEDVLLAPIANDIYNSLESEEILFEEDAKAKKIDDCNIDYVIDNLLKVCPEVSERHKAILSKYIK